MTPRQDRLISATIGNGIVKLIEPQVRFASRIVRPVACKTLSGQYRPYLSLEIDRRTRALGLSRFGRESSYTPNPKNQKPGQGKVRTSRKRGSNHGLKKWLREPARRGQSDGRVHNRDRISIAPIVPDRLRDVAKKCPPGRFEGTSRDVTETKIAARIAPSGYSRFFYLPMIRPRRRVN
jgi:hypothetical protein